MEPRYASIQVAQIDSKYTGCQLAVGTERKVDDRFRSRYRAEILFVSRC